MPFMMHSVQAHQTPLDQLVAKGLIYDLLVKLSPENDLLRPLIARLDEEKENKEVFESVSYSQHLKERDEIKQKLVEHEQRHAETVTAVVDPFATPKWAKKKNRAPSTPAFKSLEEYDSPHVPSKSMMLKEDSLNDSTFSPELKPLQSSSFNKANDLSMQLFDESANSEQNGDYTGFNFSVDKAEEGEDEKEAEEETDDEEIEEEMEVVETRTIEDKMVDISICSSLSTPSETMTPSFDWSGLSLERVATFKDAMALRCCAFAPNRDELIFGSNGSSLRLASNLAEHRESILPQFTLDQVHEASVYCCAYSSDGELLATGSNDKMVKFIARGASLESDEPQLSVTGEMGRHEATVRKVAFLPTSSRLISGGGGEGTCFVTECATEQVIAELRADEEENSNLVTDLVCPTETMVYTVLNGQVHQWDVRCLSQMNLNIGNNVQSISCSPGVGANFIATGAESGQVALWDIRHATLPLYQYAKHKKAVRSLSLVDEWLGAVSMDGLISVHHHQKTDGPVIELGQAEKVICIQLAPDLKHLATTSSDGWLSYYRMHI